MEIYLQFNYPFFNGPDILCKFIHYLQAIPLYASPFLLIAISIDRYQVIILKISLIFKAICRPLVHYRSDRYRRPNALGSCAWIVALFFSLPQIFIWYKPNTTKLNNNLYDFENEILPFS